MTTKEQRAIYEAEDRVISIFLPSIPARVIMGGEGMPGTILRHKAVVPASITVPKPKITKAMAQEYIDFLYSRDWFAAAFPGVEPMTVELKSGGSHCRRLLGNCIGVRDLGICPETVELIHGENERRIGLPPPLGSRQAVSDRCCPDAEQAADNGTEEDAASSDKCER